MLKMKQMKMRRSMLLLLSFAWLLGACKKENTPVALLVQSPTVYSETYYANLRDYKNSDHARCFIWLADYNVQGGLSASLGERFLGVPDSVDIISLWGGFPDSVKNPNDYSEMRLIQKTKGTKLLSVVIVSIGNYPRTDAGIAQYVEELKKQVYNDDLDGLDLDYEPSDGFFTIPANFVKLVAALSQFLGPRSGTGKILDIDYYGGLPPAQLKGYFDFVVQQDYAASSDASLQSAYDAVSAYVTPNQYFATENMGDYWQSGGVNYTDSSGKTINSLLGFAKWNPKQGRKGGFGAFYVQRDYYNAVPYGYLRAAIQACNPAKK